MMRIGLCLQSHLPWHFPVSPLSQITLHEPLTIAAESMAG